MLQLMRSKINLHSIFTAIIFGFIIGGALYKISNANFSSTTHWVMSVATVAVGLIIFLVVASRQEHLIHWLTVLAVVLLVVEAVVASQRVSGVALQLFITAAYPIFAVLGIGAALIGVSDKKIGSWPDFMAAFFAFFHKAAEALVLTFLGAAATSLLGGLVYALFNIVGIEIPEKLALFLMLVALSIVGLMSVVLTYDFSARVRDQEPVFGIVKIFTLLAFGVFWIITAFTFLYLIILVPSGFGLILKTGKTVPTFLGLIGVGGLSMYAMLLFLEARGRDRLCSVALGAATLLATADLVLAGVAAFALGKRIAAYGWTFDRIVATWVMVIVLGLLVALVIIFVHRWRRGAEVEKVLAGLRAAVLVAAAGAAFMFMVMLAFDFEMITFKSQVARAANDENIKNHLDRDLVEAVGDRAIDYLVALYPTSSRKMKLDILITLNNGNKPVRSKVIKLLTNDKDPVLQNTPIAWFGFSTVKSGVPSCPETVSRILFAGKPAPADAGLQEFCGRQNYTVGF